MSERKVDEALALEMGLKPDEWQVALDMLGRYPSLCELGVISAMWSEHCSYKSSRKWLREFPTTGPQVVVGPGENAGAVDIGDGQLAVFKMESHNHPSYIEPYQGAATGVGGILRDVFTMGARPMAALNALRFGAPDHPKTRHLVSGVVGGIGGYGNCFGVPTVGGECTFDTRYDGNILVNAMAVGIAHRDKLFLSKAAGIGNPVMYVGAKTGRDGIHGATMASAEFDDAAEEKRPTVQVGDPFTEKRLLEACLELMDQDAIVAIQDMGAAGLTSSSVEMAGKGGLGIELNLDRVPLREEGMSAYEIMLSESQERMLMVVQKGREDVAREVFEKWELDVAVIGRLTDTGKLVLKRNGKIEANLDLAPLAEQAPMYDRPHLPTPVPKPVPVDDVPEPDDLNAVLLQLIGGPDLSSRRWIWEQYDHMVGADTVARPGGDAAVVRVHGTGKALAMTTDCTPRYCEADPEMGGRQAVAEAVRNLTAVGATPLAITDCLNFGNPERPEIMGQIVGCILGMAEACRVLSAPVVSGNVSLYNETSGRAILPTPAVGAVGLLDAGAKRVTTAWDAADLSIVLIGETDGHLGQSVYLRDGHGRREGAPPPVDLDLERKTADFVRRAIQAGHVRACHDLSDGGLAVGLAEMVLASGMGAEIAPPDYGPPAHAWLFGEDQARYLIAADAAGTEAVLAAAGAVGLPAIALGRTGGNTLTVGGLLAISIEDLKAAHQGWFPAFMDGTES